MVRACDIINKKYNKLESKYGSTRSTLFGRFYEKIISKWLEEREKYTLERWPNNKVVRKPRIYWNNIFLDNFNFSKDWFVRDEVEESLNFLKNKKSHCTLDGTFKKNDKFYIWEAKNWPLYPEKGPKHQIRKYLTNNPWIFDKKFDIGGKNYEISGFLFSFWNMELKDKTEIEEGVNQIIGENKFKIILTQAILDDCLGKQYDWYREIIKEEKANIDDFFDQLLSRK
ncbi:MAG: hypothetical protein ACE5KZ_08350 [Candidatus Scalinduaceae bacterium]